MAQEPGALAVAIGEYGAFEGAIDDQVVFGAYRKTGVFSSQLVSVIADRLFEGGEGTLLDVGANIGLIAIAVTERCRARCLAFEPEPRNYELLCRNVRRHRLEHRIETHALALDEKAGRRELALSADNSGDHRLVHGGTPRDQAKVMVRAARLDDLLVGRALSKPIVIKLDCQGAEARVLRGASRTLPNVDHLVVEYWPAGLLRLGDTARALQELLLCFPHAALLSQDSTEVRLQSTASLCAQLAFIRNDGSDEGFFDLLLSRHAELSA